MKVRFTMVNIDHANDGPSADKGDRQKSLIRVFDQGLEPLKAAVRSRILRKSNYRTVLHHPSSDAFANFQADVSEISLMRDLGSSQYDLACLSFDQVNEAGITLGDLGCQADDLSQHLVQREL